jgi:hypothetical protein
MIPIGTLDDITAIVGERGVGKSTKAIFDVDDFRARTGGIILGHSPNGQIGDAPDIRFYDSIRDMAKGLRKEPAMKHFVVSGASPEDVIDYARLLSLSLRREGHKLAGHKFNAHRPAPKGTYATPIKVVVDEGTHLDTKDKIAKAEDGGPASTRETKELEKFLTSARHEHIALTWLIQAPTARSWRFMEQSNRFFVFRYVHEWGGNALRAAGLPQDEVVKVRTLPKFRYLQWFKDDPTRISYKDLPEP